MTAIPEGYGPLVEPIGDWTADALCAQTYSSNRVPTYCSRTCAGKQRAINKGRVAS